MSYRDGGWNVIKEKLTKLVEENSNYYIRCSMILNFINEMDRLDLEEERKNIKKYQYLNSDGYCLLDGEPCEGLCNECKGAKQFQKEKYNNE